MIWKNGSLVPSQAAVSADDRAFLIGDGVFETLLVENGAAIFAAFHAARMTRGLCALGLAADAPDFAMIANRLFLACGSPARAALRCTVSRGGGRGLAISSDSRIDVIASLTPLAARDASPIPVIETTRRRFAAASTTQFKCVGAYAENLLARADAAAAGADEALMRNESGRIACATAANVYALDDTGVVTPAPAEGAMAGCARAVVARCCARLGVSFTEGPIDDLLERPLFVTNSLIGVRRATVQPHGAAPNRLVEALDRAYEQEVACDREATA